MNPDRSEESDLSSDSDNQIYEAVNVNKTSDSDSQEEDNADNDNDMVSNSEYGLPSSSNGQQSSSKLKWDAADPDRVVIRDLPFTGIPPSGLLIRQDSIDYFRDIFTDEPLMQTFDESNKCALQVDIAKPHNLTQSELEQFIGILFLMSVVKMPSTRDCWDEHLQYEVISNVMSVRRFEQIKRFLHCNNSRSIPIDCTDKLYKIRPVIDTLLESFQLPAPTEYLCIVLKVKYLVSEFIQVRLKDVKVDQTFKPWAILQCI